VLSFLLWEAKWQQSFLPFSRYEPEWPIFPFPSRLPSRWSEPHVVPLLRSGSAAPFLFSPPFSEFRFIDENFPSACRSYTPGPIMESSQPPFPLLRAQNCRFPTQVDKRRTQGKEFSLFLGERHAKNDEHRFPFLNNYCARHAFFLRQLRIPLRQFTSPAIFILLPRNSWGALPTPFSNDSRAAPFSSFVFKRDGYGTQRSSAVGGRSE